MVIIPGIDLSVRVDGPTRCRGAVHPNSPGTKGGSESVLVSYQTMVELIVGTTTRTGLNVKCGIDPNLYPAGMKVSDMKMAAINVTPHEFHGGWNYSISPRRP